MSLSYRPEVDGLRTLAVLPVILFHAGLGIFRGGYVGVDVFFVISGYLITSILLEDNAQGRYSLGRFYERRVRRILPALFLVMLCAIPPALAILLPTDLAAFGKSLIAVPLFVSNLLFWSERGYFGAAVELKPLVHTWSLAVEEQFYILYPPLLALLLRRPRRWRAGVLGLAFVLSLAASWYLTRLHFETAFYLPFARVWELMTGALAAALLRQGRAIPAPWGALAAAIGVALILTAVFTFNAATLFPGVAALLPVGGTFLVILASPQGNPIHRILALRPMVWIGLLSYSLYLWHQPIFAFLHYQGFGRPAVLASLPLVLAASIASFFLVERPVRQNRRLGRRTVFAAAAALSAGLIAAGLALTVSTGLLYRYGPQDRQIMRDFQNQTHFSETLFDSLQSRPFDGSGRRRILLVGDSHARDLMNMAHEAGLDRVLQFSTKRINAECGNLYVKADLTANITALKEERCRIMGRFDDAAMQRLAGAADEIWLDARWFPWVVEYLPDTVRNLERDFGAKVRVFGPKNFGEIDLKRALQVPVAERSGYRQPAAPYFVAIDDRMTALLPAAEFPGVFVELLDPLCGGDHLHCNVFTPEGALISSDGGHLLASGARFLADRLKPLLPPPD